MTIDTKIRCDFCNKDIGYADHYKIYLTGKRNPLKDKDMCINCFEKLCLLQNQD